MSPGPQSITSQAHLRGRARTPLRSAHSLRDHLGLRPSIGHSALLGRYSDCAGSVREVLAAPGARGTTLVIDRDMLTHADARLVAHLGADEPEANATVTAALYIGEVRGDRPRCRPLQAADASCAPYEDERRLPTPLQTPAGDQAGADQTLSRDGLGFSLVLVKAGPSIPHVRWMRSGCAQGAESGVVVSLREVVAQLEDYEPARAMTRAAIGLHRGSERVSTTIIRQELQRVLESPIVLNRLLREAVLARLGDSGPSMSEIAMRCGRVKRDSRGNESGETSWLARRLGLLPEGGQRAPTPWVHSDVLALIARDGLGVSPREVEL